MENLGYFISQNLTFCLSFIFVLAIYIIFEMIQSKKAKITISVQDAVIAVNKNKGLYLDTRVAEQFKAAHIIGAQNIEIVNLEEKYKRLTKHKKTPIIIYGDTPEKALMLLNKAGFEQVYILKGGLPEWLKAGYPVKSLTN